MEEIIDGLFVGGDKDVASARKRHMSILSCAKAGPDSHRSMLGYETNAAPWGTEYLFAQRGHHAAMNCIDVPDPKLIPTTMLLQGIKFIKEERDAGRKVLVHCNQGHSRGPTTTLMFLRAIGEMPQSFARAQQIFKTLYAPFDPGDGMKAKARELWDYLPTFFRG